MYDIIELSAIRKKGEKEWLSVKKSEILLKQILSEAGYEAWELKIIRRG